MKGIKKKTESLLTPFVFMWYNNGIMKRKTSFTLSVEAMKILTALARRNGLSKTAMLELLIRERAKADKCAEGAK